MGIVSIQELTADRDTVYSIKDGRTYEVTLDITTDDQAYGHKAIILDVGLSPGIPYRFPLTTTATETDFASFLQSIKLSTIEEGLQHRMTLSFAPYDATIDGPATGPLVD